MILNCQWAALTFFHIKNGTKERQEVNGDTEREKKVDMEIFQILTRTPLDLELQSHLARCTTQRESKWKRAQGSDSLVSCSVSRHHADEPKITQNSRKHPVAQQSKHF